MIRQRAAKLGRPEPDEYERQDAGRGDAAAVTIASYAFARPSQFGQLIRSTADSVHRGYCP